MKEEKLAIYDLKNVEYEELFNALEFKLKELFSGLSTDVCSPNYFVLLRKLCSEKLITLNGRTYTQIVLPIRVCSYETDICSSMVLNVNPFEVEVDNIGEVKELNSVLRRFMIRKFPTSGYTQDYIDYDSSKEDNKSIN